MPDVVRHYGVKGMHWGKRKEEPHPTHDRVVSKNGKIKEVTLSKERLSSTSESHDAARAAILKKTAQTKSTDALSNKELQDLVTRMNLEQQYSRLNQPSNTSAKKIITDILVNQGKQEFTKIVQQQLTKQVGAALQKK